MILFMAGIKCLYNVCNMMKLKFQLKHSALISNIKSVCKGLCASSSTNMYQALVISKLSIRYFQSSSQILARSRKLFKCHADKKVIKVQYFSFSHQSIQPRTLAETYTHSITNPALSFSNEFF